MRQFPSKLNKLFGIILFCAIADLALDIIGSHTIDRAAVVPVWLNSLINTAFYSLQVIFPALMMSYVVIMAGRSFRSDKWMAVFFLPAAVFEAMLLINPFTGMIFHISPVDGVLTYIHGPLFPTLYVGTAFYLVVTVILALTNRSRLDKKEFSTIICFILVVVAATLLQYIFPRVLLTGVAISIAILMMFFTLQNPESMLDLISGVFNYSSLITYLGTQIREKRGLWLIAADVGGIRRVNSDFGVQVGNQLLEQIGAFLNAISGRDAWAFRMIGTRFLIVANSKAAYDRCLRDISERFGKTWRAGEKEFTLSVTVRHFDEQNYFTSAEEVINLFDVAYARAASEGWGGTLRVDSAVVEAAHRAMKIEGAIRAALDSGNGFYLNYQPLFSVTEGKYTSAEVLLRLKTRELGAVSPAEFIPVAEKTGLIYQIDRLVISMAHDFINNNPHIRKYGLKYLEINLSAAEFSKDTGELIRGITEHRSASPEMLCFEVTETAAVTHRHILADFMEQMINIGYNFALDDFGTGYANIIQVAQLPFSIVKLDRSLLVSDMAKERILFEDLLRMFGRMGLKTVVEGVETHEQAQLAGVMGADHIQGYFYCHPLSEQDFLDFMMSQSA